MKHSFKAFISASLSAALVLTFIPTLADAPSAFASTGEGLTGTQTYDTDGFFQGLDPDSSASDKFGLDALEKLGIYFDED
ncbi:MAG: hypothetical protein ACOX69_05145, partial [Coriobacteriales bacterium]